jgi:hypothetical protein
MRAETSRRSSLPIDFRPRRSRATASCCSGSGAVARAAHDSLDLLLLLLRLQLLNCVTEFHHKLRVRPGKRMRAIQARVVTK